MIDQIRNIRFTYQWPSGIVRPFGQIRWSFGWFRQRSGPATGTVAPVCRNRLEDAMTSNIENPKSVAAPVRAMVAVAGFAIVRFKQLATAIQHRRDVEQLARFDDRMLADIGLARSDLDYALGEPFWRDPGHVLTARAGERRAAWPRRDGGTRRRIVTAPSIVPDTAGRVEKLARC
jgi:uncharacterized protein YjiS (DUF1127 family)